MSTAVAAVRYITPKVAAAVAVRGVAMLQSEGEWLEGDGQWVICQLHDVVDEHVVMRGALYALKLQLQRLVTLEEIATPDTILEWQRIVEDALTSTTDRIDLQGYC